MSVPRTHLAQRVINLAETLADDSGAKEWDIQHLFLALLKVDADDQKNPLTLLFRKTAFCRKSLCEAFSRAFYSKPCQQSGGDKVQAVFEGTPPYDQALEIESKVEAIPATKFTKTTTAAASVGWREQEPLEALKSGVLERAPGAFTPSAPLGIKCRKIWEEQRRVDVAEAILRYLKAGINVPIEWIDEIAGDNWKWKNWATKKEPK